MSWLRPLKIRVFGWIGRPRCEACGDARATAVRVVGPLAWLVCAGCAAAIDADLSQGEPLEETR